MVIFVDNWVTINKNNNNESNNWTDPLPEIYELDLCLGCSTVNAAGQHCDCTEHDMPKDRTISRLRGELHRLQEQMKASEATKEPKKLAAKPSLPTIFVITPTYAR